jgi:hypothetical protein
MSDILAGRLYDSIATDYEPRKMEHWHASSIAECPRSHYYKRLGVPAQTKPTAAKMLRWDAGHIIEEVIRPHLLNIYPDLVSNVRLTSEDMDLTGEYDNYSESNKLLIEVKSVGPRAPRYRKVTETRHHLREDAPYLSHEYQNHAYVMLLREAGLPIEHITYVYITLEGLIITYDTDVQQNLLDNVQKRLGVLQKSQDGYLPACICKPDHPLWGSTMQFCDYKGEGGCCSTDLLTEEQLSKLK